MYVKKLEGRQGFPSSDFKRAIAALVGHGVLRGEGDMLFITAEWDRHRYDGKGHEGMPSYVDKHDIWDSGLSALFQLADDLADPLGGAR
ncbi:MAG: hypothetical protein H0U17_02770 [Actinobacteria bacterium]|nr:hypothetical protein [Actinomycetota bacterium]MDQ3095915.1 hypothetical protein [Actinomycetota bacterium]